MGGGLLFLLCLILLFVILRRRNRQPKKNAVKVWCILGILIYFSDHHQPQPAKPLRSFVDGAPSFARTLSFQAPGTEEDSYSRLSRNHSSSAAGYRDVQTTYSTLGQTAPPSHLDEIYTEPVAEHGTYSSLQRPHQPDHLMSEPEQSTYSTLSHAAPANITAPQQEGYSVITQPALLPMHEPNYQNYPNQSIDPVEGVYDEANELHHTPLYHNMNLLSQPIQPQPGSSP